MTTPVSTPTPRKPKALTSAHTDLNTREAKLYAASQVLSVPSTIIEDITGLTKGELLKCLHNTDTVPLEKIGAVDRFLAATALSCEFELLPTSDMSKVNNILAICFTLNNQDGEILDLNSRIEELAARS